MADNSIDPVAAAPEAAPEITQASAPAIASSNDAPSLAAPEVVEEPKFDWVPAKFLRDGKPDFETMAKSYTTLEKKIGQKGAFAPESVDEYAYDPKSIQFDPEDNKAFKEFAKEAGLSTAQYAAVLEKYEEVYSKNIETPEKAERYLKETWGDDYTQQAANARKAFETYVPSDIPIEAIGNNPYLLRVLAQIGSELHEDPTPSKAATKSGAGQSKADIQKLMSEPDYWKNASKQALVQEWYAKNL